MSGAQAVDLDHSPDGKGSWIVGLRACKGSAGGRSFRNPEDDHSGVLGSYCRAEAESILFSLGRQLWRLPQGRLLVIAEQLKDNEG